MNTISEESRPVPALMIPLRRCGSHALRLRLNFNTDFYSPYPLHIVDFMPLLPLYGDLSEDRNYFQLVVDVVGLQAVSMVKWPDVVFDPVEIFEALAGQPRSVHKVAWELLLRAGERHRARVVMDKSLDNVHYAAELLDLFPQMRFLNVVRDPRAQVASINRAIIHDFDTILNARTWLAAYQAADRLLAEHPDKVLTIRYEDFLTDQQMVLRQVCDFFGIAFMPQMLDIRSSAEAAQIAQRSALWSSNHFPPIIAHADKFKQQLSMREIEIIETACRPYMERYGYTLLTEAALPLDENMVIEAEARSRQGRQQAWDDLKQRNYRDYILRQCRADYLAGLRQRLQREPLAGAPRQAALAG
ncbi:sulfotransferase [Chromobacterium violaceum]|uniref:sulfotransferase family protein n=1 Tax=Chromobacterium violaceum TaxID=536 RepID=UPI000653F371|nr:sulfotransferase [Chromobacterium violaceum]KMN49064.1 sulfotransferase [Chromobacterium violaceum]KMN85092.1 sulfotransferase [Chromobacterium violaceum]KMN91664.1 sulfotransferase [Chromobacterium violaceum]KMO02981.1 sulfotransferase [Chromobacterium violaceum]